MSEIEKNCEEALRSELKKPKLALVEPCAVPEAAGNDEISEQLEDGVMANAFPFHKLDFEVLYSDPLTKTITLSGKLEDNADQLGVIVAEKVPLTRLSMSHLFTNAAKVEKTFQNDIYSQYKLDSSSGGGGEVKVMTVFPATQKHLEKYGPQNKRMVQETPQMYQQITKPYVLTQAMSLEVCDVGMQ